MCIVSHEYAHCFISPLKYPFDSYSYKEDPPTPNPSRGGYIVGP